MRLFALVLFGVPLAVGVVLRLLTFDPFAAAIAAAFGTTTLFLLLVQAAASRPAPRKIDIERENARLERELGIGQDSEPEPPKGCTDPNCPHEHYTVEGGARFCLPSEAPTTVVKPPERRSIYNPDGSLRANVCWGCGMPATTSNAGWPVCATCREENVGIDGRGSTRSVARQGLSPYGPTNANPATYHAICDAAWWLWRLR